MHRNPIDHPCGGRTSAHRDPAQCQAPKGVAERSRSPPGGESDRVQRSNPEGCDHRTRLRACGRDNYVGMKLLVFSDEWRRPTKNLS
jgi:hypothetical protein